MQEAELYHNAELAYICSAGSVIFPAGHATSISGSCVAHESALYVLPFLHPVTASA